jgi:histidinol-phosphate aminotransferase
MTPYAPGEQLPPGKYIKLNTNENPYPPPPAVVEAIRTAAAGPLNRYPDPMATAFRRAAADALGLPGPDWVLAGNGSDEILTILVRGFVDDGQRLRLPYPSYILYRTLADIQGASWEQVPFDEEWKLPAAFGESDNDLRLVLLPNPNSPSGTVVMPDEVAAIGQSLDCPLVIDEAYADFAAENCMDLALQNDNVLVARTFSKSYSLAGIRLGYCVGNAELIGALYKIKDSYNVNYLTQEIARVAVLDQDTMHANVQAIVETRKLVADKLSELGFQVCDSETNFLWIKPLGIRAEALFGELRKKNIVVRHFGNDERTKAYLRVTIGTAPEMFKFLDAVEEINNWECGGSTPL